MTTSTENLGPADRIIQSILGYTAHLYHGRPGYVVPDRSVIGVAWSAVTTREVDGQKVVFKTGRRRSDEVRLGVLGTDGKIVDRNVEVGVYRPAGIFPEVAAWIYKQVAEVWKLDNEFAARWASHAFTQEHRDLKIVLAAFMLAQSRCGQPVKGEDGKVLFSDDDFREVGEAMCLLHQKDGSGLNPKMLLRVGELLRLPEITAVNRELGFGNSSRNPQTGRYTKAVERWLRYREQNPKLLEGLVKAGFRTTVMELAKSVRYKPTSPKFFELLRWKQKQSPEGHRQISIGVEVAAAETWAALSEAEICQRIVDTKPNYKRIVGMVPSSVGITRAVMSAVIQAGSLSDTDLIILSPTLEELGLLEIPALKARWESALSRAESQRASNIAIRVKSKDTADKLNQAAETAMKHAVEEVLRGLRIYFMVDISGSMQHAITEAKNCITKLLAGFPPDRLHVSVFNTAGREVQIRHPSAEGVKAAFANFSAGGGTDYGAGVKALLNTKPAADEDALFIFVGDEEANSFAHAVRQSGLNPVAFGLLKVGGSNRDVAVRNTAAELGIPCFMLNEDIFSDPYALIRTLRNLIASTPVGVTNTLSTRQSLVDVILKTPLLTRPAWASAS